MADRVASVLDNLHLGDDNSDNGNQNYQLVVVASTFMANNYGCVIAWHEDKNKLLRPVTNFQYQSWPVGTFDVGDTYNFEIVDVLPAQAIPPWPHRTEDTLVQDNPVRVNRHRYTENQMYDLLVGLSHESVHGVFHLAEIKERKYIHEHTRCPSAGILRCTLDDINMYGCLNFKKKQSVRCEVFCGQDGEFNFPVTTQNRDELIQRFKKLAPDTPILVLLGLGRPFAGDEGDFDPRRCYILVIGVIIKTMQQEDSDFQ